MKVKFLILGALIFFSQSIFAQNEEIRELGSFKGVKSSASIKVIIDQGPRNMVKIESDEETSKVLTEINNGVLSISRESKSGWSWTSGSSAKITCYLTYADEIEYLKASSSSRLELLSEVNGSRLSVKASSSGRVVFSSANVDGFMVDVSSSGKVEGKVNAKKATFEASSSGAIYLNGNISEVNAKVSSSGKVDAERLQVATLEARASSSGKIMLAVSEEVRADVSSSGKVYYRGNPKIINADTSSGGKVQRM